MFALSPYDLQRHAAPSPFALPYSDFDVDMAPASYLPPSYASYDRQRSQLEQALLARRQQERREAEAQAILGEQRRLQQRAAVEQAIREEHERRELAKAIARREEEERQRRYLAALKHRRDEQVKELRRQQQQQRQLEAEDRQRKLAARAPQPTQQQRGPAHDFPTSLFDLLFGLEHPTTATPSSTPVVPSPAEALPTPAPATIPAPVPVQVSPAAASHAPVDAPEPEAKPTDDEPMAKPDDEVFRRHLARRNALDQLATLTSTFSDRQAAFVKPASFVFKTDAPLSSATPALAFGSANSAFLGYEDFLVNLLSKIDAVESGGDRQVKRERKELVRKVEKELSRLDAMKDRAWEEQTGAANTAKDVDAEMSDVVVAAPAPTQEVPVALPSEGSSSTPAAADSSVLPVATDVSTLIESDATPAPPAEADAQTDDEDDSLPPLFPLTHEAVSALSGPEESSRVEGTPVSRPASPAHSDSGSSTTSSTLSVSSQGSAVDSYISEMLRRAQKLGEEVARMELDEAAATVAPAATAAEPQAVAVPREVVVDA